MYIKAKKKFSFRRVVTNCALVSAVIVILLVFGFPIFWLISMSLKAKTEIFSIPPEFILFRPTIVNYKDIFLALEFIRFYKNSLIVAFLSTGISLVVGVTAAYSLSRLKLAGKEHLAFMLLTMRMAPPIGTVIPLFLMMKSFRLLDTYIGLALIYLTFNTSYVVWLMRGFFEDVPREIEECAWIDGCSRFGGFFRIMLPLTSPGIAATAIICFIFSWNEFFFALIMTGERTKTVPVTIMEFMTHTGIEWGNIAAGGTLVMIPVVIFALLVRKRLTTGLTFGAIKG